jgi:diguanylate cyclase (GGDEF)-like protein
MSSILIVEDSRDQQKLLKHHLKKGGITDVILAESAKEAFEYLGLNDPDHPRKVDLILMDILLPGTNGIEACRLIKAAEHLRDIPIIMVTGMSDLKHLESAFASGAMDYIVKPTKKLELLARVRSSLKLKHEMDMRKAHELELTLEIEERRRAEEALSKRVKELNCLYGISELVEKPGISLEEILQRIVDLIPTAWQYPEITCVRAIVDGHEFRTENFREIIWKQTSDIIVQGGRIGTLEVSYLEEKQESDEGPFQKEERKLINAIAERMGKIVEHQRRGEALQQSEKRHRELSITDDLTKLYNSRHFFSQLKAEIERVTRYNRPVSLLLLDIDNFKHYNDRYGHLEGDKVLAKLGEVLLESLRKTDSVYRYGGEEFTVILPETGGKEAINVAERIRKQLETETFCPTSDKAVHVTASIGVAQYIFEEEFSAFVKRADNAMYIAKRKGKNRVFFSR